MRKKGKNINWNTQQVTRCFIIIALVLKPLSIYISPNYREQVSRTHILTKHTHTYTTAIIIISCIFKFLDKKVWKILKYGAGAG